MSSELTFKTIPGIDPMYSVGSDGNVYSTARRQRRKLACGVGSTGAYLTVSVKLVCGKRVSRMVHVLVCAGFHGVKPNPSYCVAHGDGNGQNNAPENLRWSSNSENHSDKFLHGTHDSGTSNTRAKLDKETLFVVRFLLANASLTHQQIGNIIGESRVMISKVANRSRYGNIDVSVTENLSERTLKASNTSSSCTCPYEEGVGWVNRDCELHGDGEVFMGSFKSNIFIEE